MTSKTKPQRHRTPTESHTNWLVFAGLLIVAWAALNPAVQGMKEQLAIESKAEAAGSRNGMAFLASYLGSYVNDPRSRATDFLIIGDRRLHFGIVGSGAAGTDVRVEGMTQAECLNVEMIVSGELGRANLTPPAAVSVNGSQFLDAQLFDPALCRADRLFPRVSGSGTNDVVFRYRK